MRKIYPGLRSLLASALLLMLAPTFVTAANNTQEKIITEGVSAAFLEQNLQFRNTEWLKRMLDSPEHRAEYVKSLYSRQKLEREIVDRGLDKSKALRESLEKARRKILLNELVRFEFEHISEDIKRLAKERYMANPGLYKVRKRIKIALIFIKKTKGMEDQARKKMDDIVAQMKAQPESNALFYQLAEEYSDGPLASQGGVNKKWLIAPEKLKNRTAILQAAFALETPGQMTDIVESEQGFNVVRLLKVVPARQLSFEDAKSEIMGNIKTQLQNIKRAEVIQSLQADDDLPVNDEIVKDMMAAEYATRTSGSAAE